MPTAGRSAHPPVSGLVAATQQYVEVGQYLPKSTQMIRRRVLSEHVRCWQTNQKIAALQLRSLILQAIGSLSGQLLPWGRWAVKPLSDP